MERFAQLILHVIITYSCWTDRRFSPVAVHELTFSIHYPKYILFPPNWGVKEKNRIEKGFIESILDVTLFSAYTSSEPTDVGLNLLPGSGVTLCKNNRS
jgi:hypothetical protein